MPIHLKSDRIRYATLTTVALLLGAAPARAQRLSDLPIGTRLRVQTDQSGRWHDVVFAGVQSDSLAFQEATQRFLVPRGQIQALEWRDRDANRWPHVLMGAGLGTIIVGTAAAIGAHREEQSCQNNHGSFCGFAMFAVGPAAAAGLLSGAVVGALLPVERWHAVDPPLP